MHELGESAEERVVVFRSEPDLHHGRLHLSSAALATILCVVLGFRFGYWLKWDKF